MGCQGPTHALEVPPLRFSEGVRNLGDHALFGGDLTHARLPAPVTTTRSRLRAADSGHHLNAVSLGRARVALARRGAGLAPSL